MFEYGASVPKGAQNRTGKIKIHRVYFLYLYRCLSLTCVFTFEGCLEGLPDENMLKSSGHKNPNIG